jgi:SAM-dependent methyltransferase
MTELYDQIGNAYAVHRRPDPKISALIQAQLQGVSSLLNVGAGYGSYEPDNLSVVAVEPSAKMISQRQNRSNVVQAKAEALPFCDNSFDASMAGLTIHHWQDRKKGLEECARVARKRLVILTWDPDSDGFWLEQKYFPEILALDRKTFPSMEEFREALGHISVYALPIPADCIDGFLGAYWHRPSAYLDPKVRMGISSFYRIGEVETRIEKLRRDLASGVWERKHRHLLAVDALDVGYRLVIAEF